MCVMGLELSLRRHGRGGMNDFGDVCAEEAAGLLCVDDVGISQAFGWSLRREAFHSVVSRFLFLYRPECSRSI